MYTKIRVKFLLTLFVLISALPLISAEENTSMAENLEPISIATQTWLEYVDKDQYEKSWAAASDLMKLKVSQKDWTQILNKLRKPLGFVSSRQLLEQRLAKDPKGLPAGDYAVMFYKTAFSTKPLAYELVTLYLEAGQWKVLTYQVN